MTTFETAKKPAAAAPEPDFALRLAAGDADLRAAQALRYRVFVREMGGGGVLVDHDRQLERDRFDAHCDHLMLIDRARAEDAVVGVYRLMTGQGALAAGGFYSEGEYDLTALKSSGRRLLELGRSCLDPEYRGGSAMMVLWGGLADYVARHRVEILFGTASFPGTDTAALAAPLSLLHHRHLAPEGLRPRARGAYRQRMDLMEEDGIDRLAAMRATPALIKAYLRLGGCVGDGAFVDHEFNTTDVCMVVDTGAMTARARAIYGRAEGSGR